MTTTTLELINAIAEGDAVATENALPALLETLAAGAATIFAIKGAFYLADKLTPENEKGAITNPISLSLISQTPEKYKIKILTDNQKLLENKSVEDIARDQFSAVKNIQNEIIYIGQQIGTKSIDEYKGSGLLLNRAYKKYVEDYFKREIFEYCSVDELNDKEKLYIKQYNTKFPHGYNLTDAVLRRYILILR